MQRLLNLIALLLLLSIACAFAMRDPTRPPAELMAKWVSSEDKRFVIQSVLHGPDRHLVIINGTVLRVGDTISGVKVLKIGENSVQLMEGAKVFEIGMYKKIKEPSSQQEPAN